MKKFLKHGGFISNPEEIAFLPDITPPMMPIIMIILKNI
jgi:hypothetical protein